MLTTEQKQRLRIQIERDLESIRHRINVLILEEDHEQESYRTIDQNLYCAWSHINGISTAWENRNA